MRWIRERAFLIIAVLLAAGALVWALDFEPIPPADFVFVNGTEIQTVDPALATGSPEHRIIDALFQGLYQSLPVDGHPTEMSPQPGVAESHTLSDDGRTYTFKIRKDAQWSDGSPITAHDFVWSWKRFLHPETGTRYGFLVTSYVENTDKFNSGKVEPGDRVEVELYDRPVPDQTYPSGTFLKGILKEIVKPPEPDYPDDMPKADRARAEARWQEQWVYVVEIKPTDSANGTDWDASGAIRNFSQRPGAVQLEKEVEKTHQVLINFDTEVPIRALDDYTLEVKLKSATPYFLDLVAFYSLYPVNRACVEKYGWPNWTKAENLVCNGPYVLESRKIRDRIRLVKNPRYWDAENVQVETIDALAAGSSTTQLNLYMDGLADWATDVPSAVVPELERRDDFISAPMLTVYFYRINVTREGLDNKLVRQALNMAIDKENICRAVLKAGQEPARSFVPPGLTGYQSALGGPYDPERAKELLAQAGYPNGRGFPKIEIVYNTLEAHRAIAEVIQQNWKKHLGINAELKNLEWGVFLDYVHGLKYKVSRNAWIGDYPDPNTFLDLFVTDGPQNETGWSNKQYDELIAAAAREPDPQKRMEQLHDAEAILMDELPILPIYFYVSINMVRPYVKNFHPNIQDVHPLHLLRIDQDARRKFLEKRGLE